MGAPVWHFDTEPSKPRAPHVMFAVFSQGPLRTDVPMSLTRFGAPGAEALAAIECRAIPREADPAWFDGWRSGALRAIAAGDLGQRLAELDGADRVNLIIVEPQAPTDLGYLQAAWAVARHFAARGAAVVLDVHAATFRTADALPPAGAPLDVRAEVRVVFETDSARPDGAHALHTRGMRKFGAPDLVALCSAPDSAFVGDVIGRLADAVARGTDLASPRHAVDLDAQTTWYAIDDAHGLGALLELNNPARILVDGTGHHLVGAAARQRVGMRH
jgi:hypothetical protein